jgi:hypothetical protein
MKDTEIQAKAELLRDDCRKQTHEELVERIVFDFVQYAKLQNAYKDLTADLAAQKDQMNKQILKLRDKLSGAPPEDEGQLATLTEWFMDNYPKAQSKGPLRKELSKALRMGVTEEELREGVQNLNAYLDANPEKQKFVCMPARWIADERYSDRYNLPRKELTSELERGQLALRWKKRYESGESVPESIQKMFNLGPYAEVQS